MTKKTDEQKIRQMILWLRNKARALDRERAEAAALAGQSTGDATKAYQAAVQALFRIENYMLPEDEGTSEK